MTCVMGSCFAAPSTSLLLSLSESHSSFSGKPSSLSWVSSFPSINVKSLVCVPPNPCLNKNSFIQAAWTRRSRGELANKPNRKSWKQRTDMYMRPFLLNVFFSKRFIHAKVMHRGTSKVISVATTNAKDLRNSLPSLTDNNACRVVGQLIAERSKEADVYVMSYEPRKNERIEGKLDTVKENGIIFVKNFYRGKNSFRKFMTTCLRIQNQYWQPRKFLNQSRPVCSLLCTNCLHCIMLCCLNPE